MPTDHEPPVYTIDQVYSLIDAEHTLPAQSAIKYFWCRKMHEVLRLFGRNAERFLRDGLFVELGCGKGRELRPIISTLKARQLRYLGTDIVPNNLALCRQQLIDKPVEELEFGDADITKPLPWEDGSIDVIYASEVFEHIKAISTLLDELHRVLKPGGHICFTTPNEPNLFQLAYYGIRRHRASVPDQSKPLSYTEDGTPLYGHVTIKTNNGWNILLEQHGFALVDFGRGAIWYGSHGFQNHPLCFKVQRLTEWFLDRLPRYWVRNISSGVIALYQKT